MALFLVGFTLVLNRRTRPPVLVPGLILAVYVAGWALWIHAKTFRARRRRRSTPRPLGPPTLHSASTTRPLRRSTGPSLPTRLRRRLQRPLGRLVPHHEPRLPRDAGGHRRQHPEADQAQADAETAVSLSNEQDFTSLFLSGLYRFYDDDFDWSARRMRQALEVNDRAPEAYLSLAAAELARGNTDEAVDRTAAGVKLLGPAEDSAEARQLAADLFTLLLVFGDLAEPAPEGGSFTLESSNFDQDAPGQGAPDGNDRATLSIELGYAELPPDSAVSLYVFGNRHLGRRLSNAPNWPGSPPSVAPARSRAVRRSNRVAPRLRSAMTSTSTVRP
ncbi:MAG: hypothetical protein IPH81_21015 [Candidatus Microthrix sp.]|nr:hypothetical protein [Candidatus Microthrix sp.]